MTDNRILWTEGLCVNFDGLVAVNRIDAEVFRGETLGLIGPNGSGKTTLFNAITGLYAPSAGNVYFDGQSLLGKPPYTIARKGIARTFQTNRLCLDLSVLDNVLIGMHYRQKSGLLDAVLRQRRLASEIAEARERAARLLSVFNEELVERLGEPADLLPMIDRRRVEICRAMIGEPRLLLLDEPSAGMNPEEKEALIRDILTIRKALKDASIVIIEHDMTVIKSVTERVIVLNYGLKVAQGTFGEISQSPQVQEAYLGERT